MKIIVQKLIKMAGGQEALAKKCGVRQQSISKWLERGNVPVAKVLKIEKIFKGAITRYELRPDIYPKE